VGLKPIVVHGGGPEISKTLERLGSKPEFIDGQRVTHAADLKVVEMVLTGSINTELVTLLNRSGANAVGLSGKDGALLKAPSSATSGAVKNGPMTREGIDGIAWSMASARMRGESFEVTLGATGVIDSMGLPSA